MIEPWVQTHSGVAFDLLAPRASDVRIADIAHHLSRISRFSGATLGAAGYSVAQHSVLCADLMAMFGGDARLQREALLHDAGEAYYGDWTSPVMGALRALGGGEALNELRRRVDVEVRAALDLEPIEPVLVKRADLIALAIERKLLMAPCERDWLLPELADTRWEYLPPTDSRTSQRAFLDRFEALS